MKTIFNTTVVSDLARAYRIRRELSHFDERLAALPGPAATPEPPAAVPSAAAAGEPGPAVADGTAAVPGPVAGPGGGQDAPQTSAPGAAQDTDPATPRAGEGQPEAVPGAEHGGGAAPAGPGETVTREEIEAEFGPAPAGIEVTVSPGTAPMADCQQPYEHGWDDPTGIQCDVPEHHEDGQAAEAEDAPDAEPQP